MTATRILRVAQTREIARDRARFQLSLVVVAAILLLFWAPGPASAATNDLTFDVPSILEVSGTRGEASTDITLPQGANPTQISAVVTSTYSLPGRLLVTVGDREVGWVGSRTGGTVLADLNADDLDDGRLRLGFRVSLPGDQACFDQTGVSAVLADIAIGYQLPVTAPETVADFVAGAPRSVTISISDPASTAVQEAALNAVAVMANTFPASTEVSLEIDAPTPANPNLDRLVVITEGGEPALTVRDGVLFVTGEAGTLSTSVRSLASDQVGILGNPVAGQPEATVTEVFPSLDRSLTSLGFGNPSLTGVGAVETTFFVRQSEFGRPISALDVTLTGNVTPANGGTGRANLLINGRLVDSVALGEDPRLDLAAVITGPEVLRENAVTLALEYVPRGGECTLDGLPARLDIDGQASTISGTGGQTQTGFEMFPQALGSVTPVAWGNAQDTSTSVMQAGHLIAALQPLTPAQLVIEVQDWPTFVAGNRAGIAVGVGPGQDNEISTPLKFAPFRTVSVPTDTLSAEVTGSYGALQAYIADERALLVLGSYGQNGPAQANRLADLSNVDERGWFELDGSLAVAQPGQEVVFLALDELSNQPEQTAVRNLGTLTWVWWIAGALVVGLIGGLWFNRRRRGRKG